jgi:hypothetical protein
MQHRFLVGKTDGRRLLRRPSRRWKSNIKMNLREMGWGNRLDRYSSESVEVEGGF